MEQLQGSGYKVHHIILLESSFSQSTYVPIDDKEVDTHVELSVGTRDIENNESEFSLCLAMELKATKNGEDVFEINAKMVGFFEKIHEAALSVDTFKNLNGPAIIYPFLREHVYSLISKAGLGTMMLPSVSFQPR